MAFRAETSSLARVWRWETSLRLAAISAGGSSIAAAASIISGHPSPSRAPMSGAPMSGAPTTVGTLKGTKRQIKTFAPATVKACLAAHADPKPLISKSNWNKLFEFDETTMRSLVVRVSHDFLQHNSQLRDFLQTETNGTAAVNTLSREWTERAVAAAKLWWIKNVQTMKMTKQTTRKSCKPSFTKLLAYWLGLTMGLARADSNTDELIYETLREHVSPIVDAANRKFWRKSVENQQLPPIVDDMWTVKLLKEPLKEYLTEMTLPSTLNHSTAKSVTREGLPSRFLISAAVMRSCVSGLIQIVGIDANNQIVGAMMLDRRDHPTKYEAANFYASEPLAILETIASAPRHVKKDQVRVAEISCSRSWKELFPDVSDEDELRTLAFRTAAVTTEICLYNKMQPPDKVFLRFAATLNGEAIRFENSWRDLTEEHMEAREVPTAERGLGGTERTTTKGACPNALCQTIQASLQKKNYYGRVFLIDVPDKGKLNKLALVHLRNTSGVYTTHLFDVDRATWLTHEPGKEGDAFYHKDGRCPLANVTRPVRITQYNCDFSKVAQEEKLKSLASKPTEEAYLLAQKILQGIDSRAETRRTRRL